MKEYPRSLREYKDRANTMMLQFLTNENQENVF